MIAVQKTFIKESILLGTDSNSSSILSNISNTTTKNLNHLMIQQEMNEISSLPSSLSSLISKSMVDNSARNFFHGIFRPRWSSSSLKPDKMMNDRLSAVIDAITDYKLPPELRGRHNSVRLLSLSDTSRVFLTVVIVLNCSLNY